MTIPTRDDARLSLLPKRTRTRLIAALRQTAARPRTYDIASELRECHLYEAVAESAGFPSIDDDCDGPWVREIPLASELTDEQRVVAEIVADVPGIDFSSVGLYTIAWVRRRWVGLDPPGALFGPVSFEHAGVRYDGPLFPVLRRLASVDEPAATALIRSLPVRQRLELLVDLGLAASDYGYENAWTELVALRGELADEGRDCAAAFADRVLALYHPSVPLREHDMSSVIPHEIGAILLLALARAGIPIEPRWDVLLSLGAPEPDPGAAELIAVIPEERREAALVAALERYWPESTAVEIALSLLPLYPFEGVLRFILSNLAHVRKPRDVKATLRAVARDHPALSALLRSRQRAALPSPARETQRKSTKRGTL